MHKINSVFCTYCRFPPKIAHSKFDTKFSSAEKGRYSGYISDSADKTADITYTKKKDCNGSDTELKLDIYTPSEDTADKRPVIIWVHGGGMRSSADRFFFGRGCSNSGNCDIL